MERTPFLPFNFNSLLSYLNQKTNRDNILDDVKESEQTSEDIQRDMNHFFKLFNLENENDEG